jgi:hypothetical protein
MGAQVLRKKDMWTCNHNRRSVLFREVRDKAAALSRIAPLVFAFLIGTAAYADDIQDANQYCGSRKL